MKTYKDVMSNCVPEPKNDVETLDESFLSSITTAVSLSKTVQIQKRIQTKKLRTKRLQQLPVLRDDHSNLDDVLKTLDKNLHTMHETVIDAHAIAKEDNMNLSKLIAINTFATRLFLNPTKRKRRN